MEKNNQPGEDNCLNETLLKCIEDQENGSKNNEDDEVDSSKDSDVDFYDEGNELEIEGDDETEGELGDNENLDVENSEGPAIRKVKNDIQNVNGKKQKRRKRDMTKRRKIRKIYDESQLEQETLSAQLEEKERLRRLELQKSLATEITPDVCKEVTNSVFVENANHDTLQAQSPVAIDFRQKGKQKLHVIVIDSDDDSEDISFGNQNEEEIEIISSDSVCSSSENDTDDSTDIDENNVGMHSDDRYNVPNPDAKVEVNINHPLYEDDIYLAPQIAKCVKPHQIGGIRFLYDNLVETLARYKVSSGFGCILAHSMGLGKTLQVIAFTDIFLRHTPAKKVLCVVPINTIQNWITEFNMWLPPHPENIEQENKTSESEKEPNGIRYRNFEVYQLSDNNKTTLSRARLVGEWNQNGGVLLMGYELYRVLAMSTPCMASNKCAPAKKRKSNNSSCVTANLEPEVIDLEEEEKNMDLLIAIQNALCNPGPDLVVCDEGHRIKNNQANISQALKRIRTKRRVVLTGYPLQNNLIEYWCMVDFVRPNFLGTRHEFSNMFERPILNGQCSDSTPSDVKLMRYRAHVLHNLLEGFVQRRSQSVLMKCLPLKEEHIILVKLSQIQSQLYDSYINFLLDSVGHLNPIKGFHTCTKIWNHPDVFFSSLEPKKSGLRNESPLTLLDNDTENSTSQDIEESVDPVLNLSALPVQVLQQHPNSTIKSSAASLAWAKDIMKDYQPFIAEQGGKMAILFEIIEESLSLGEKVLVFSQSLSTLCVIEDFLSRRDIPPFPGRNTENDPTKWAKNKSYFRLDGSTPSQERDRLITAFNSPDNTEVLLFMLSTRAGCLGVNLVGASRVVVFDASWNPCHDVQAVCRVYRYGQKKSSHIYRLISTGTMEKKIYDRQVSKQGVANRVVDELNPEANFTKQEIMSLICDKEPDIQAENVASAANEFSDPVLKRICKNNSNWLSKIPFKHESLLVDKKELKLTKKEKQEARKGYEREKTMSQQGGRYNYNHPESKRKSSTTPIPSNIVRPVPTDRSVQANQLGVMTNIAQRMQSQAFPLCMEPSFRLATYFRNISTKSNQLGPMMPNLRTANLQMQINNPMVMSTNVSNPIESQIIYPSQRCMQSGVGFASTILPCSSMNLTNGSAGSTMSYPAHLSIRVPKVSSTQTWPQTNEIVKIDLDDVPSPVSSPVELDEAQNHGTINPQNGQRLFEIQDTQSTLNPDYNSGKNPDISMTGVVVVDSQQRNISMESTSKSDLPKQVINSLSAVSRTATEDIMNVETPGLLIAVTKDAPSNDVKHISISTLATERRSPLEPPPIVVLQNSLSERGGVGSSDGPSTESLSEDLSARTSQM